MPARAKLWPFLLMLAIVLASGQTRLATPDLGFNFSMDKLAHFLVFGLLATAVLRNPFFLRRSWRGALAAALIVSICGLLDEFRQSMTPGRMVELGDWIADTLGAGVAVAVYLKWAFYRNLLERPIPRLPAAHKKAAPKSGF